LRVGLVWTVGYPSVNRYSQDDLQETAGGSAAGWDDDDEGDDD
jgi:hypothetical protein